MEAQSSFGKLLQEARLGDDGVAQSGSCRDLRVIVLKISFGVQQRRLVGELDTEK